MKKSRLLLRVRAALSFLKGMLFANSQFRDEKNVTLIGCCCSFKKDK
jgi:hypothetical protein